MNKLLKKIKDALKGLNKDELENILNYYEEIISDRLEAGESIKAIESSMDLKEVKSIYIPEAINKREHNSLKESTLSNKTLLAYLLTSPIWIPLGIAYLTILFAVYVTLFSFAIVMVVLPISFILIPITIAIRGESFGNIFIFSGFMIMVLAFIESMFYLANVGLLKLNNFFIRLFSKFVLRKGDVK